MAVAIRNAIADQLGIASTEMGYGCRSDKELGTGHHRTVIQIFDQASGGAGFVLAGLNNVSKILKKAMDNLICSEDCDNVCSHCLAGKDSRIELTELDRRRSLKWIKDCEFTSHMELPKDLFKISSPVYCSFGPYRFIKSAIDDFDSSGVVSINLNRKTEEWDLLHPQFYDQIMNWLLIKKVSIELNIPEGLIIPEGFHDILLKLNRNGISFNSYRDRSGEDKAYMFCQIQDENKTLSLYSSNEDATIPNEKWLNPGNPATWMSSEEVPPIANSSIDTSIWDHNHNNTVVIDIHNELNG
ncbi:MAG: DUF1998 domain-containing protein, partial [Cytophagales bacterium]|nr:DUF1998 domain-containing protein [Cytophagales bacterium]